MSFSLKTLLGVVTVFAVTLVGSQKLHRLYCLRELNRCVENGDLCSVIELLGYAEDQNFSEGWADETWVTAAKRGDFITLRHFSLKNDLNRKIEGDQTALMLVAANGHFNMAKFLLVQGVDTTIRNASGKTAFDIATSANQLEIATLIAASQSDSWEIILRTELMVKALNRISRRTREQFDELLSTKNFSELAILRIEKPQNETEIYWFQAAEGISIGLALSNNRFTWMLNGNRVEDVEFFYSR